MARFFSVRKGSTFATALIPVAAAIVALMMMLVLNYQAGLNVSKDIDTLARQAAKEIASEVSAISVVDQGVRFYDVSEEFAVALGKNFVSVAYSKDRGPATYTFPHVAGGNAVLPASVSKAGRICISKKLVQIAGKGGCTSEVTICKHPDGACCALSSNKCMFAG